MRTNGIIQLAPCVRILIFLVLGIWIGSKMAAIIPFVVWPISILLLTLIAAIIKHRPIVVSSLILVITFFLGCFVFAAFDLNSRCYIPNGWNVYKSVVSSRITEKNKIIRCDLMVVEINNNKLKKPIKIKASIMKDTTDNRWKQIKIGNGICHYSKLERPRNFNNNSSFDYQLWMKCHGYKAQTFIPYNKWYLKNVNCDNVSKIDVARISSQMLIDKYCNKYIRPVSVIGNNTDNGLAILSAMTLGDKSHLDKDTNERYSVAGASHILALSGLHLSIIFSLISILIGGKRRRNIAIQIVLLTIIWTYTLMVGMPTSIIRATSMLTIYSLVGIVCSKKMSLNILAFTAFVMLIVNPLSLWDVGFQLSFLSVACILIFGNDIAKIYKPRTIIGKWIWTSICISIAAQIGTAPIVAYYFGRFSCYFALVNLIVIPLATIIIFGTVIAWILTIISPSFAIGFWPLAYIADKMDKFVAWVSTLPHASIEGININHKTVVGYYLILFVLIFVINRKKFR